MTTKDSFNKADVWSICLMGASIIGMGMGFWYSSPTLFFVSFAIGMFGILVGDWEKASE